MGKTKKTSMKRPAAKKDPLFAAKVPAHLEIRTVDAPFDLKAFVDELVRTSGLPHPKDSKKVLPWASGFDGLNSVHICLQALGLKTDHVFGAEIKPTCQAWGLRQGNPKHLFQDWSVVSRSV